MGGGRRSGIGFRTREERCGQWEEEEGVLGSEQERKADTAAPPHACPCAHCSQVLRLDSPLLALPAPSSACSDLLAREEGLGSDRKEKRSKRWVCHCPLLTGAAWHHLSHGQCNPPSAFLIEFNMGEVGVGSDRGEKGAWAVGGGRRSGIGFRTEEEGCGQWEEGGVLGSKQGRKADADAPPHAGLRAHCSRKEGLGSDRKEKRSERWVRHCSLLTGAACRHRSRGRGRPAPRLPSSSSCFSHPSTAGFTPSRVVVLLYGQPPPYARDRSGAAG